MAEHILTEKFQNESYNVGARCIRCQGRCFKLLFESSSLLLVCGLGPTIALIIVALRSLPYSFQFFPSKGKLKEAHSNDRQS